MTSSFPMLSIPVLFLCASLGSSQDGQPEFADGWRADQSMRVRIDRLSEEAADEPPEQSQIDFAGNLAAWLISRTQLSAAEESQLAATAHQGVLQQVQEVSTPEAVETLFAALLKHLPEHLKPREFSYTLTVVKRPEPHAFTVGGGYVYVSQVLLEVLLDGSERGRGALAYVLAHELGHVARLHCRRGYQLQRLQSELRQGTPLPVDGLMVERILETSINQVGRLTPFLYSRNQEFEADLFALHLCRNAGIEPDVSLDWIRWMVFQQHPAFADHPDPRVRLKRLRHELEGRVDAEERFGLFEHPIRGQPSRAEAKSAGDEQRAVILMHGLWGKEDTFEEFLKVLAVAPERSGWRVFTFRYPGNQSLARSGELLCREMERVFHQPQKATFICHSAGGLVFRYYAERKGGGFQRAVFLGTPHGGSSLTRLKFLLDIQQFLGLWNLGVDSAIREMLAAGEGQITHDLHPDSLFLRYLGQNAELAARYDVFQGRYYSADQAWFLRVSIAASRTVGERYVSDQITSPVFRQLGEQALRNLDLPDEIANGDLVVSVPSASLQPDTCRIRPPVALDHLQLKSHESILGELLKILRE